MIFNMSQGGESYISVTAPSGAQITATIAGETKTGTGSCTLAVHIVGTWTVTSTLNNTVKTTTVDVASYGQTVAASFAYSSIISVTTHPSASVTATKSGMSNLTGTADANGNCNLTVPAGGLGSWNVTANNGATSASSSVDVAAYDATYGVQLLRNIPIIVVSSEGNSWTYKGATIDNSVVKITPNGTGWKAWLKASCSVKFNYIPTNVSFWAIGKGGNGGARFSNSGGAYGGGGGGGGGQVVTQNNKTVSTSSAYTVIVNSNGSSFGSIISAGNGGNGGSPSGGASGGGSGSGSGGEWVNDHSWPSPTSGGGGDGGNGVYAFGDASFDGVIYGHGGGGGHHSGGRGYYSTTNGSGGAGSGGSSSGTGATEGIIGIICMRNAS